MFVAANNLKINHLMDTLQDGGALLANLLCGGETEAEEINIHGRSDASF
jgi:hypothetical protein